MKVNTRKRGNARRELEQMYGKQQMPLGYQQAVLQEYLPYLYSNVCLGRDRQFSVWITRKENESR